MEIIADLHIHGRYSRATSKELSIANLEKWAGIKGINLLGTGDFTHPKWMGEIKTELKEEDGILRTKNGFPFVLQTEVSLIYTWNERGRRIHNIILAPNIETAEQITGYFKTKGRVDYDGRPIFKIPCPELVESLRQISDRIEVIPAHCLVPGTYIHSNPKLNKIEEIREGDKVLTHNGHFKRVSKTYRRHYKGKVYKIIPWYFREGLITTPEHPFYAIRSFKRCLWTKGVCKPLCCAKNSCKKKVYEVYRPGWVQAKDIEKGDFIVYPRIRWVIDKDAIRISDFVKNMDKIKKGSRIKNIKNNLDIDADFCRLAGYYLAEGYIIRNEAIGFSFNKKEEEYIREVIKLMKIIFGIRPTKIDNRKGADIIFYSYVLNGFFRDLFYSGKEKRAWTKSVPGFMLYLPAEKQTELLRGWWRGDAGYTVSHELANQMKTVCIRLGIIPSISKDSAEAFNTRGKHFIGRRRISANRDTFIFSNLSFFESKELLKDRSFRKFVNKRNTKHGWIDERNIYLPVRKIETQEYKGEVYNLEVDEDNSYVSEFAAIHNCWTPWFSLFGSMSGFDSVEECFEDETKHVHALETGLSSNPEMNWRLSQLDRFSLVSFSDLHSFWPWRIGREATIFKLKKISYDEILKALRNKGVASTIEVDPAYGKYHVDGHRNCGVRMQPEESVRANNICPVCKKPLTIGVLHRVEELADRKPGFRPKDAPPFESLIPLSEILSSVVGSALSSKKIWGLYWRLVKEKTELEVLRKTGLEELQEKSNEMIAKTIIRFRNREIKIKPGYDGVYGVPIMDEKKSEGRGKRLGKAKQTGKEREKQKGLDDF